MTEWCTKPLFANGNKQSIAQVRPNHFIRLSLLIHATNLQFVWCFIFTERKNKVPPTGSLTGVATGDPQTQANI